MENGFSFFYRWYLVLFEFFRTRNFQFFVMMLIWISISRFDTWIFLFYLNPQIELISFQLPGDADFSFTSALVHYAPYSDVGSQQRFADISVYYLSFSLLVINEPKEFLRKKHLRELRKTITIAKAAENILTILSGQNIGIKACPDIIGYFQIKWIVRSVAYFSRYLFLLPITFPPSYKQFCLLSLKVAFYIAG